MSILADNIKKYRELKGLTQLQLAEIVGKSKNVISNWENALNKPDTDSIEILLDIFEIDANELLGWNDRNKLNEDAKVLADKILNNAQIKKALPKINALNEEDMKLLLEFIERLSKEN